MAFADTILPEFDTEMKTTRTLLERVPFDREDWKPHTKSTAMGMLASHVANLAGFGVLIASNDEFNFAPPGSGAPRQQPQAHSTAELIETFDRNVAASRAALQSIPDSAATTTWTLKAGDHTVFALPRATVIRTLLMNHIIHHRGQLSVYLRLNDVPLPSIYGPTADTGMP